MQKFCITCQAPHSGTSLECEKCSPTRPVESTGIPEARKESSASHANPPVIPESFQVPTATDGRRKMGILLVVGIFFLPWVFAWLTLRKGHSKPSKVISFAWLALLTIGMIVSPKDEQSPQTSTPTAPEIETSEGTQIKSPVDLCSMPKRISKDPEISKLGGGKWKKSDFGDYFVCQGGADAVEISADSSAGFHLIGSENRYSKISVSYVGTLIGNDPSSERNARQRYLSFLDEVCIEMFGEKIPEDFRKKISNNPISTSPGKPLVFEKASPNGYLALTVNNFSGISFMYEVEFYKNAEAYERFKDL